MDERKYLNLQHKLDEFDLYFRIHFDPKNAVALYNHDPGKFREFVNDIYKLLTDCGGFKTAEEIRERNRALVVLQMCKIIKDVVDSSKIEINEQLMSANRKIYNELKKQKDTAILKYTCALGGIGAEELFVSTKINLDQITWVQTTHPEELQKKLENQGVNTVMSIDHSSPYYNLKAQTFGKGGMVSYTFLMPSVTGGYKLDGIKSATKLMDKLLSDDKMQAMISAYESAEKMWLTSAASPSKEIENRLRFVNAFDSELKELYLMINNDNAVLREAANKAFEKYGISELIKDYKAFRDPENKNTDYLTDNQNEYAKSFRGYYQIVLDDKSKTLTKKPELREVHKYLLGYGDYGSGIGTDVFNVTKQVRPFIENFISLPEEQQLKALYMLEHKMYKTDAVATNENIANYTPNVGKINDILKASNFKFWKRATTSYMYWNKLKICIDRVRGLETPPENKKSVRDKIITFLGLTGLASKVSSLLKGTLKAIVVGVRSASSYIGGLLSSSKLPDMEESASNIQIATKTAEDVSSLVDTSLPLVSSPLAFNVISVVSSSILTASSVTSVVSNSKNKSSAVDVIRDVREMMKDNSLSGDQKKILEKMETHARIIEAINHDKVRMSVVKTVNNVTGVATSALMIAGLGPAMIVPYGVASVLTFLASSKIQGQNVENVLDTKRFADSQSRKNAIENTKKLIKLRYRRLPENLRLKHFNQYSDAIESDDKILGQLRQETVRSSGQINQAAAKNFFVQNIGNDLYNLIKTFDDNSRRNVVNENANAFNKKMMELANKLIVASGGRRIEPSKLHTDPAVSEKENRRKVVEKITGNMSV